MGNKKHPTEKPTSLMGLLITNSSNKNDVILDPFMGAGSTGLACIETGRKFIGMEIDSTYYKIAVERVEALENKGAM